MTPTSATTATAKWDPPKKNAEVVELYRILWRAQGSVKAKKVDTSRYLLSNIQYIRNSYIVNRKIASSNTSRLEAHVGFFRLLMKGIFGPYVLKPFDKS